MTDNMKSAFENGRGWYRTIEDLLGRRRAFEDNDREREAVEEEIQEGPLSVLVRDGWRMPGQACVDESPDEYEILLSTGGPALRIYGKLDQYCQPETAELQAQDWGTQWTRVPDTAEPVLLAYASCFYFGE